MKLTKAFLNEQAACSEGLAWFLAQKETDGLKVVKKLIRSDREDWANWLIVRIMTRPQYLAYAIFAAEQVLHIWEKKYSDDKRPREAIEAAKAVLKDDTPESRSWAAEAAWAAWAAEAAEAAWAAWAAEAAGAAGAAWAAGAAEAAWVAEAAWAAGAAGAAWAAEAAARKKMQRKILTYGLKVIEGGKQHE